MSTEITDEQIAELRRFAAHPAGYHMSKEVLAGLLARLERSEARVATLEAALKSTFGAHNRCAACGLTPEGISGKAHSEDCLVGAALRGVEGKPSEAIAKEAADAAE